jgi:hypothetical protein
MQLAPMRYGKIEGTNVTVHVTSPDEARIALKELRLKKKELAHVKKALLREQREAKAKKSAADRSRRGKKKGGLWGTITRVTGEVRHDDATEDIAHWSRQLENLETLAHNIDGCILQIETKLLKTA